MADRKRCAAALKCRHLTDNQKVLTYLQQIQSEMRQRHGESASDP